VAEQGKNRVSQMAGVLGREHALERDEKDERKDGFKIDLRSFTELLFANFSFLHRATL